MISVEQLKGLEEKLVTIERLIEASLTPYETTPSTRRIPEGVKSPLGIISNNMDIEHLSQNEIYFLHSMLHLFHSSKTGKGLSSSDIEQLHGKVKERLSAHKKFDNLDREMI